jgi:uncharacterized membrane-anchored protein YitT (DUF2179 family)
VELALGESGEPPVVVQRILASRRVRDFALMSVGILLTAFALDAFLIPNKLAAGGVSGLATVIHYAVLSRLGLGIPVGVQMLAMNVVLLVLAWRFRGLRYVAKTLFGAIGLSIGVDLIAPLVPHLAANDLLLAAIWGGAVSGLGMGLVFKGGGNTGGTDIVAQLLSARFPFGVGQLMLVIDAGVSLLAAIEFGPNVALYGVVAIFVSTATIDLVLEGVSVEKAVIVISDAADAIGEAIVNEMGRGATRLEATGVYTGERRGTIYVVLSRNEIDDLKAIVKSLDPTAMVIISNVHETIGEGFRQFSG